MLLPLLVLLLLLHVVLMMMMLLQVVGPLRLQSSSVNEAVGVPRHSGFGLLPRAPSPGNVDFSFQPQSSSGWGPRGGVPQGKPHPSLDSNS